MQPLVHLPDPSLTRCSLGAAASQPCPLSSPARKALTVTRQAPPPHTAPPAAGTLVVEEARFAIVPEWVIDAAISDGAFRLYSLLLR